MEVAVIHAVTAPQLPNLRASGEHCELGDISPTGWIQPMGHRLSTTVQFKTEGIGKKKPHTKGNLVPGSAFAV